MAYNKIMDKAGNVLLDLTNDTVTEDDVLLGKTFHDKSGVQKIGTLAAAPEPDGEASNDRVNFFDYDGTLVASYSIEEAQQLTSLPPLPDHTDDNLTSEGWTETLEFVNSLTRGFNVGVTYHTTDGYTYVYMDMYNASYLSPTFRIYMYANTTITIDWGDGTVDEVTSTSNATKTFPHTYSSTGSYVVKIISTGNYYFSGSSSSSSRTFGTNDNYQYAVTRVRLSNQVNRIIDYTFYYAQALRELTISESLTYASATYEFYSCYSLKIITLPKTIASGSIGSYFIYNCRTLETVIIPSTCSFTSLGTYSFYNNGELKNVTISDKITTLYNQAFGYCSNLKHLYIPDIVTSINTAVFTSCGFESFTFPKHLTTGCASIVSGNLSLKEIIIPDGCTYIPNSMVDSCCLLKKVTLPGTINNIGNLAFSNCYSLEEVDLTALETPPTLGTGVFSGAYNVKLLISADVIEQFKAAPNWSTWAHLMVPVEVN